MYLSTKIVCFNSRERRHDRGRQNSMSHASIIHIAGRVFEARDAGSFRFDHASGRGPSARAALRAVI